MKFNLWGRKEKTNVKYSVIFNVLDNGEIQNKINLVIPNTEEEKKIFIEDLSKLFFYIQSDKMTNEFCKFLSAYGATNNLNKEVSEILGLWQNFVRFYNSTNITDNSIRPTEVFGQYIQTNNMKG